MSNKGEIKNNGKKTSLLKIIGVKDKKIKSERKSIFIRTDINNDIEKYCSGTYAGIVNYLLRSALDQLIRNKKEIIVDE